LRLGGRSLAGGQAGCLYWNVYCSQVNGLERKTKVAALGFQSGSSSGFDFADDARTSRNDGISLDYDRVVNHCFK
jgi:hypothetical protein